MAIQIEHIDVPKEWETTNEWDSHRPALWLALCNRWGRVIEIGCGEGSTKLLSAFCHEHGNMFFSLETNPEWADKFSFTGLVPNYKDALVSLSQFLDQVDILFIDCAPGELRKELISDAANIAMVIVVHDTEPGANYVYGMADILSTFKYRLDYVPEANPWTTIVSNFVNVEEWKQPTIPF